MELLIAISNPRTSSSTMTTTNPTKETKVRLLADENEARKFAREFLIPYKKARIFQCMVRDKYATDRALGRKHYLFERKVINFGGNDASRIEHSFIRQLRKCDVLAEAGFYTDENDVPFRNEWMVAYITANPLDEDDASDAFITHVLKCQKEDRYRRQRQAKKRDAKESNTEKQEDEPVMKKITSTLETMLHRSPCRINRFLKLDIDTKDPNLLDQLYSAMQDATIVVAAQTRGGYHVILERGQFCQNLWKFARGVNATLAHEDQWITIEDGNGPLFAIPGTNQGGFTVRVVTDEWKAALARATTESHGNDRATEQGDACVAASLA